MSTSFSRVSIKELYEAPDSAGGKCVSRSILFRFYTPIPLICGNEK